MKHKSKEENRMSVKEIMDTAKDKMAKSVAS